MHLKVHWSQILKIWVTMNDSFLALMESSIIWWLLGPYLKFCCWPSSAQSTFFKRDVIYILHTLLHHNCAYELRLIFFLRPQKVFSVVSSDKQLIIATEVCDFAKFPIDIYTANKCILFCTAAFIFYSIVNDYIIIIYIQYNDKWTFFWFLVT